MSRLALIDGDILVYRMLAAASDSNYVVRDQKGEVVHTLKAGVIDGKNGPRRAQEYLVEHNIHGGAFYKETTEPPIAYVGHLMSELLDKVARRYSGGRRIFLSADTSFRNKIYPEYKANRPERPRMVPEVREMLVSHYGAFISKKYEADDEISMAAGTSAPTVMVSIDKDFLQVPGVHYDPFGEKEVLIDPIQANINLWSQVIAGDAVDNIKGVPNFGLKKAFKYLQQFDDESDFAVATACLYTDSGLGLDDMVLNYRLVKLLGKPGEEDAPVYWLPWVKDIDW